MPRDRVQDFRIIREGNRQLPTKLPRPAQGEHFLKGPIPLDWLKRASQLPGRSLHVGLMVWYLAGLKQSSSVSLSNKLTREFGIDRNAKYRALEWLAGAGLITVASGAGRAPSVTLRPVARSDTPADQGV